MVLEGESRSQLGPHCAPRPRSHRALRFDCEEAAPLNTEVTDRKGVSAAAEPPLRRGGKEQLGPGEASVRFQGCGPVALLPGGVGMQTRPGAQTPSRGWSWWPEFPFSERLASCPHGRCHGPSEPPHSCSWSCSWPPAGAHAGERVSSPSCHSLRSHGRGIGSLRQASLCSKPNECAP